MNFCNKENNFKFPSAAYAQFSSFLLRFENSEVMRILLILSAHSSLGCKVGNGGKTPVWSPLLS